MMLTIHTLFNDPNIVNAVIQRVLKTRKDTIIGSSIWASVGLLLVYLKTTSVRLLA